MTRRGDRSGLNAEPYSPHRRTALLMVGAGTAGAYHAGALRALHEAGVKVDVMAGRGMGALMALFAAVDGASRLWDEGGFWKAPGVSQWYPWHPWLRVIVIASGVAAGLVLLPLLAMALGLIVFPIDFVLKMLGLSGDGLAGAYLRVAAVAFAPTGLPTWLPRLAVLALATAVALLGLSAAVRTWRRRERGPLWWRMVPALLTHERAVAFGWTALWNLVRGAAHVRQPEPLELARRYAELLSENIGQPGFRELLISVHDIDARRDLVGVAVTEMRRRGLTERRAASDEETRHAEVIDLSGALRELLVDLVAGALTIPVATTWHALEFPVGSYWSGETHRIGDRPSSVHRLLRELVGIDVEQIVLIAAAPPAADPHEVVPVRRDGRGRLGEWLMAAEAAAVEDALHARPAGVRLFVIRPEHNPIGPLDFAGGFDDRSDRPVTLVDLMALGYQDAFRQFVEPVVAPSGDRVGSHR